MNLEPQSDPPASCPQRAWSGALTFVSDIPARLQVGMGQEVGDLKKTTTVPIAKGKLMINHWIFSVKKNDFWTVPNGRMLHFNTAGISYDLYHFWDPRSDPQGFLVLLEYLFVSLLRTSRIYPFDVGWCPNTSLGKCPPRMTCSGGQPLGHVLAAFCDVPFFSHPNLGGSQKPPYHQLSLGQAPHDAKGIHHLHQKTPGRSLVGICYIAAVGKGLRTYPLVN